MNSELREIVLLCALLFMLCTVGLALSYVTDTHQKRLVYERCVLDKGTPIVDTRGEFKGCQRP